jgi:polyhydroxyalkanoate synthase subunit PhaC
MTADAGSASLDGRADGRTEGRGEVPHDETGAVEAVENGEAVAIPSVGGLLRGLGVALAQAGPVTREARRLARDTAQIVRGTEDHLPSPKDKRFSDPAWSQNPVYRRLGQFYLASGSAASRLIDDLEAQDLDWHDVERARFAVNALTSALAPTNIPFGNPAALKRAFDTAGSSVVRGLRNLAHDVRHNGGMPSQTDRTAFTVGEDLALTPGAVVHRTDVAELIQYTPSTPNVRRRPVLVIPPPIGRYYFLDLRPGRSFVEYAVSQGLQVFMLSWRNPQPEQAEWGMDDYAGGVVAALDSVREITGADDVNTIGFCAGGILMSTVLSHLAQTGSPVVHSASYGVTLLDFDSEAPIGAFSAPRLLELARQDSRRKGIISARSMGTVFAWMRPDDLVFNYLVNQWLMGEDPPVFDILAWNADGTNLPARLHDQFLGIFRDNNLVRPGGVSVLGTPVDLSRIEVPTFVTGAVNDHLTPWKGCYRTTQLLSGPSTFVLSNAGHVASLVNPPGNPKATYWAGGKPGTDPETWQAGAEKHTGSWWEAWAEWVLERSGDEVPAPADLGSSAHPPLEPAPGSYVLDRDPSRPANERSAAMPAGGTG